MKNLFILAIAALAILAGACSGKHHDKRVEALLEMFQSEKFHDNAVASGIYTDTGVDVDDKNLTVRLTVAPDIHFRGHEAVRVYTEAMKASTVAQYRRAILSDRIMREGLEGLRDSEMGLRLVMLDDHGDSAVVAINPLEVLDK